MGSRAGRGCRAGSGSTAGRGSIVEGAVGWEEQ